MAQKIIYTDDLDGSPDAETYRIYDPVEKKMLSVDLAPANLKKLTDALAPYIAAGSATTGSTTTAAPKKTKTTGTRQTREYDKAGFREWAEANDLWEGKRPAHALIDQFEAADWKDDSLM